MNNPISFMSANFVARQAGYALTGGWGEGVRTTNAHFKPIETFGERFGALLNEVRALGFEAMDLWTEIINPAWATEAHLATARALLDERGLGVPSLAGWFGKTRAEFEGHCQLARALGSPLLGGNTALLAEDREGLLDLLERYDLKFGFENHPEKTPEEILARLGGEKSERLGVTLDTGWLGTHGFDAAEAIAPLAPKLLHVHLKDVRAVGGHETCRFGEGVVPLAACIRELRRVGYAGALSVEHEPETFDPREDVRASRELLQGWMAADA